MAQKTYPKPVVWKCSPKSDVQIVYMGGRKYALWNAENESYWNGSEWEEIEKPFSSLSAAFQEWLRKISR